MRPVEVARYFSKVAAFRVSCVEAQLLHVSVTCTTKGVLLRHGGACVPGGTLSTIAFKVCTYGAACSQGWLRCMATSWQSIPCLEELLKVLPKRSIGRGPWLLILPNVGVCLSLLPCLTLK